MAIVERITPHTLGAGNDVCPRWLAMGLDVTSPRDAAPFHRWDLRHKLLDSLTKAHATLIAPTAADFGPAVGMEPEQKLLYARFIETYCELFAGRPGRAVDHGCQKATDFPKRAVEVGGGVDLLIVDADGNHELRQFELWDGAVDANPETSWEIGLAVLRLVRRWGENLPALRIVHADLNRGAVAEHDVDLATQVPLLGRRLDERLAVIRARAATRDPVPGATCARCGHVRACTAFEGRAPDRITTQYADGLVGETIVMGPSRLATWTACPRQYRNRHLLDLPATDPDDHGTFEGNLLHQLLRVHHTNGPCSDPTRLDRLVDDHELANPERVRAMLESHARRCPSGAESYGHEHDVAQLRTDGGLTVMVTGRIDAIWVHDGMLDARDYKTGKARFDRVQDDPAARVQAWLLAPIAEAHGLQLRLSFEQLRPDVDDDPDAFTPDDDDLAAITAELDLVAGVIAAEEFDATPDPTVCGWCPYRSGCPDAHTVVRQETKPAESTIERETAD